MRIINIKYNKKATLFRVAFFKSVKDYPLLNTPTFQAIATTPKRINVLWTLFPPSQFGLVMSNVPLIILKLIINNQQQI